MIDDGCRPEWGPPRDNNPPESVITDPRNKIRSRFVGDSSGLTVFIRRPLVRTSLRVYEILKNIAGIGRRTMNRLFMSLFADDSLHLFVRLCNILGRWFCLCRFERFDPAKSPSTATPENKRSSFFICAFAKLPGQVIPGCTLRRRNPDRSRIPHDPGLDLRDSKIWVMRRFRACLNKGQDIHRQKRIKSFVANKFVGDLLKVQGFGSWKLGKM